MSAITSASSLSASAGPAAAAVAADAPAPTASTAGPVDDRARHVLAAARTASSSDWVTLEDVQLALHLTGRDPKLDYRAARRLLALATGRQGLRAVAAAMRAAAGWTLHWSQSQTAFYYAHKGKATRYVKVAGCPFGWAVDNVTRQFCSILDPRRQHATLPETVSAAQSPTRAEPARPSWGPKPASRKRDRSPELTSATSEGEPFARYISHLDCQKRQKIEGKREYFFSGFYPSLRSQIQMDEEASYSVTEMSLAEETSKLILKTLSWPDPSSRSITDATACIGGNTVNFARHFSKVVAVESDPTRARFLRHNVALLCRGDSAAVATATVAVAASAVPQQPASNVEVHCADCTATALSKTDLVFFDPPWGGEGYSDGAKPLDLFLSGKPLVEICRSLAKHQRARWIVLKVPFNFGFSAFMKRGAEGGALRLLRQEGIGRGKGGRPKFVIMILECSYL